MRHRRHNRIVTLLLLTAFVASTGVARAATWRCDDGKLCVDTVSTCCPPEREAGKCGGKAMSCCGAPAAHAAAPSATSCCRAPMSQSTPPGPRAHDRQRPPANLQSPPGCSCSVSYAARAASAIRPTFLPLESPVDIPGRASTLARPAIGARRVAVTADPPPRLPPQANHGSRGPPSAAG